MKKDKGSKGRDERVIFTFQLEVLDQWFKGLRTSLEALLAIQSLLAMVAEDVANEERLQDLM